MTNQSIVKPRMIVRTNLASPDYVIEASDPLEESLSTLLNLSTDPSSLYLIDNKYILHRLLDCANRALQSRYQSDFCPVIFDSWSCWNSTPPDSVALEQCPHFLGLGFRPDRLAEKKCTVDGNWWVHPATNR